MLSIKVVNAYNNESKKTIEWMKNLSSRQRQELINLIICEIEDFSLCKITRDWILDNNGEENFWYYLIIQNSENDGKTS